MNYLLYLTTIFGSIILYSIIRNIYINISHFISQIYIGTSAQIQLNEYINQNINELYYKLYIYIDSSVPDNIKDDYIFYANQNNLIVDNYINSYNKNSDKTYIEDYCFNSGFDLICPEKITLYNQENIMLDYKIKCSMMIDDRYVGYYLYSRSSTPIKTPLRLANSVGIIDSGYRGNIKAYFDIFDRKITENFEQFTIQAGYRYTQLCPPNIEYPMKVFIVNSFQDLGKITNRNINGFGSTGN